MRVQLVAQHLQLRLVCGGGGLERLLGLFLQLLVVLDTEVEATPAEHDVERAHHPAHEIHRMFRTPAILDPVPVKGIHQPAPGESNGVTGEDDADAQHQWRPIPQPLVDRTHEEGHREPGEGGYQYDSEVGIGFFMRERAQPRGDRVARPAPDIEDPEQSLAIS